MGRGRKKAIERAILLPSAASLLIRDAEQILRIMENDRAMSWPRRLFFYHPA
jgi:hypothetical protein